MTNPIIDAAGSKSWFVDGILHRVDGPAVESADGTKFWYVNGALHRIDGPAIEWVNGDKDWYVNAQRFITNKSFQEAANISDEDMIAMILKYGNVK